MKKCKEQLYVDDIVIPCDNTEDRKSVLHELIEKSGIIGHYWTEVELIENLSHMFLRLTIPKTSHYTKSHARYLLAREKDKRMDKDQI